MPAFSLAMSRGTGASMRSSAMSRDSCAPAALASSF